MTQILFDIVRSKEESDREIDYVAIGYLDDSEYPHSAFIIHYKGELFEFDYNGHSIEFTPLTKDYYHKITETILPEEVPSFIALCENIKKNAKPIYGFFYSGESYDLLGNHLSKNTLGQRMTCVGFCLNVLKGFLDEDYLAFSNWKSESHNKKYLEKFCEQNGLDISKVVKFHRRISPLEFLTSGFFSNIPITKKQIDVKSPAVRSYLTLRRETA